MVQGLWPGKYSAQPSSVAECLPYAGHCGYRQVQVGEASAVLEPVFWWVETNSIQQVNQGVFLQNLMASNNYYITLMYAVGWESYGG